MKHIIAKQLLLCISIMASVYATAQPLMSYTPIKNDSLQLAATRDAIHQRYLKDSASISGENKKYIVKFFRERYSYINDMFTEKELMASAEADDYLAALVSEIFNSNPQLKKLGTHFLFSRVYWPNAFSVGDGTIVFNIGLFAKLDNESQVIFVLCHELAHLYLDHSNKAILQYVNTVYSDDFQQELKDIKKSKYEQNKQLEKLEKGLVFKSRRHGRQHESEADSMGLVFMQHTGYNVKESLSCLGLLDEIDKDLYPAEIGLQHYFNFPEYPFQKKWMKKEESFFGGVPDKSITTKEQDSLKTHPDCKVRITRLSPAVEKLSGQRGKNFVVSESRFKDLKARFDFEAVEFCYTSKRLTRCLYQAMELLEKNPGNAYLVTMIGKCFNEFYINQKNHTLYKVVDLPSPYAEKNYNTLLEFIQNIRLDDMTALGYYFLNGYKDKLAADAGFVTEFAKSKENFNKQSGK